MSNSSGSVEEGNAENSFSSSYLNKGNTKSLVHFISRVTSGSDLSELFLLATSPKAARLHVVILSVKKLSACVAVFIS